MAAGLTITGGASAVEKAGATITKVTTKASDAFNIAAEGGVATEAKLASKVAEETFATCGIVKNITTNWVPRNGDLSLLKDGEFLSTNEALNKVLEYLGKNYKEMAPGVYKSADGNRLVRMTDSNISTINNHAGNSHLNFESRRTVLKPNGKEQFISQKNVHIFLKDER